MPDKLIEQALIAKRLLTRDQVERAANHAARQRMDLDEAILRLRLLDLPRLGEAVAAALGMKYRPLVGREPDPAALDQLSQFCARRWQVYPAAFEPQRNTLTLAIDESANARRFQAVATLMMLPFRLEFAAVPPLELRLALDAWDTPPQFALEEEEEKHDAAAGARPSALNLGQRRSSAAATRAKDPWAAQRYTSRSILFNRPPRIEDVARAYINGVALTATAILGDGSRTVTEVRSRVRYCQMMAARLQLRAESTQALIVAAWLSPLRDRPALTRAVGGPFRTEEILDAARVLNDESCIEATILSLVIAYQLLLQKEPTAARDVNLARQRLKVEWSSSGAHAEILELFLQILMDEQFLAKLERALGKILIVDPEETAEALLTSPLINDGYSVSVVAAAEDVMPVLNENEVDLVILSDSLPNDGSLQVCRQIQDSAEHTEIPVLVALPPDAKPRRVADFLRAGADACLSRPVDMEILFLMIQKHLQRRRTSEGATGVSGNLKDMSFTDMIQILSAGNRNMEVVLHSADTEGHVFLRNGQVIHAETGKRRGEDAFYAMMAWREGDFQARQCTNFPEPTILSSIMSLLMEGARQVDESAG